MREGSICTDLRGAMGGYFEQADIGTNTCYPFVWPESEGRSSTAAIQRFTDVPPQLSGSISAIVSVKSHR